MHEPASVYVKTIDCEVQNPILISRKADIGTADICSELFSTALSHIRFILDVLHIYIKSGAFQRIILLLPQKRKLVETRE
jgi:hypothetical protein